MLRAYAQLLRLPNVFTAWADAWLGVLIANHVLEEGISETRVFLVFATSTCFYWAGMVLNDVCDAEEDARDRPFRPIPSGRISRKVAELLGWGLLATGLSFTVIASWPANNLAFILGIALAFAIMLYDSWTKHTSLGALNMGACRFGNVLLAIVVAGGPLKPWMFAIAGVNGLYVAALTLLARNEVGSARVQKTVKMALMGIIVLDALLAFAVVGWPGLLILLLLPPALILGKWIYST